MSKISHSEVHATETLKVDNAKTQRHTLALIGPLLPYRGGIAQHTTQLHRSLREYGEVITISFQRQYPRWLYPGKSNFEPDCSKSHCELGVHYILTSFNPCSWIKAGRLIRTKNVSLVIIPWWTVFWAPCFAFIALYLKRYGLKILFLCHNVLTHEPTPWKLRLTRYVLARGDRFLVDNTRNAEKLKSLLPHASLSVHPMPLFQNFPPAHNVLPRRSQLEVMFFGFVRSYKGIDVLVEAMAFLQDRDIFLTIAGEWWMNPKKLRRLIKAKQLWSKIEIIDRYLSAGEVSTYFNRADVIVLPYREASGTGVIPLAYHFGKPVIATNVGGLAEFVEHNITGLLIPPNNPLALAEAIEQFFELDLSVMQKAAQKKAQSMDFQGLVNCIQHIASD